MNCRLCLQSKPLRNSHIYPEFLYEPIYDDKHRFTVERRDPNLPVKLEQKGLREELLCADCEIKFSRFEGYAKKVFTCKGVRNVRSTHDHFEYDSLDYALFKLFLMSLIWRAGEAKQENFADVNLGTHSESLQKMLFAEDPGDETIYGTHLSVIYHEGKPFNYVMTNPIRCRVNDLWAHYFLTGGILFIFHISNQTPTSGVVKNFITRTGKLKIQKQELAKCVMLEKIYQDIQRGIA